MEQNKNLDAFLNLVSPEPSGWLQKAQWRQQNKEWLDRSAKIAIRILSQLRDNKKVGKNPSNQKELADLMGASPQYINKIVKGSENLTLETIARLEVILEITLLEDSTKIANTTFFDSRPVSYATNKMALPTYNVLEFQFETIKIESQPTESAEKVEQTNTNYQYAMAA